MDKRRIKGKEKQREYIAIASEFFIAQCKKKKKIKRNLPLFAVIIIFYKTVFQVE